MTQVNLNWMAKHQGITNSNARTYRRIRTAQGNWPEVVGTRKVKGNIEQLYDMNEVLEYLAKYPLVRSPIRNDGKRVIKLKPAMTKAKAKAIEQNSTDRFNSMARSFLIGARL